MNELMLKEIRAQPATLMAGLVDLRLQAEHIRRRAMKRVVLVGSGDSGYAGIAMEELYTENLSVPTRALTSMSAARYLKASEGDLVILTSVSGEVIRTIEAARSARSRGSLTVAIVADKDSTLAHECDELLVMPEPATRATPHTRDYTASLLALGVLGERLSGQPWPELDAWISSVRSVIEGAMRWVSSIAVPAASRRVWFLASGPDRATAAYGALKFWEAGGSLSWWDELEEFAHGSHLQARPGDDVVLVATGRSWSRAAEMVPGLILMGMRPLLITDRNPPLPGVAAGRQFHVPTIHSPSCSPLTTCLPVQAITYHYACARRIDVLVPLNGRAYGPTYDDVHKEWTRKSSIEVLS